MQDEQPLAWGIFERVYCDFIRSNLARAGVLPRDIDDLRQDVLLSVARAVGKFEFRPRRASFRAWLKTLTINQARDYLRKSKREIVAQGDDALSELADSTQAIELDEADRDDLQRLYARATVELEAYFRHESIEIFMSLMRGCSVSQLARETGKSAAAIRQTKVRVLHRLRQIAGE